MRRKEEHVLSVWATADYDEGAVLLQMHAPVAVATWMFEVLLSFQLPDAGVRQKLVRFG